MMTRYRQPGPASSNYITPEGASALRRELDHLWRTQRPAVTASVAEAAAQGDRSENAEYVYGKKQLAEIDRRIRYLRKRLHSVRVVEELPRDTTRAFFGAWVELTDADGNRREYRLVGPDEFMARSNYVSIDSPLGKALIGKTAPDRVTVSAPDGERRYEIVRVRYGRP